MAFQFYVYKKHRSNAHQLNLKKTTFVFSSSCQTNHEHHGVGVCYKRTMERFRSYYQQAVT
eukprot:12712024-Heterocapsa_arctica.AAC.1